MKKRFLILLLVLTAAFFVYGQEAEEGSAAPDFTDEGVYHPR